MARAELRKLETGAHFDFGPFRDEFERVWTHQVYLALTDVLSTVTPTSRFHVKRRIFEAMTLGSAVAKKQCTRPSKTLAVRNPDPTATDQCASPAGTETTVPQQYRSFSVCLALSLVPLRPWRDCDCQAGDDHSLAPRWVSSVLALAIANTKSRNPRPTCGVAAGL